MLIQVLSDLHIEFIFGTHTLNIVLSKMLPEDRDVLIIAGDLGSFQDMSFGQLLNTLRFFCQNYNQVIYVPGNHEYYNSSMEKTNQQLFDIKNAFICLGFNNLNILINDIFIYKGKRFLGTTLWFTEAPDSYLYTKIMNDFIYIKNELKDFFEQGEVAYNFLEKNIQKDDIVITHHLPASKSFNPIYINNKTNIYYLNNKIEKFLYYNQGPSIWIHGHTHNSFDYILNETRIICNPFGYYLMTENVCFNNQFVVEI